MSTYKNGNYLVELDSKTGTKTYIGLRAGEDFHPEFPDNIDIKLTNRCYHGCPYCHENSNEVGKIGDLDEIKKLITSSLPINIPIELAFGGGNLAVDIDTRDLANFFKDLRSLDYNIGITLNIADFLTTNENWKRYIYPNINSVGISLDSNLFLGKEDSIKKYVDLLLKKFEYLNISSNLNIVFHIILGTFKPELLESFLNSINLGSIYLSRIVRILFLGYKYKGRGDKWDNKPTIDTIDNIRPWIIRNIFGNGNLKFISAFDNLAIEQLHLEDSMLKRDWNKVYMGQEGSHSMYIDGVTKTFAISSTSPIREPWDKYNNSITEFFLKNKNNHE